MTLEVGTPVVTVIDVLDDQLTEIPARTPGLVIAYQGEQIVVEFHDQETDVKSAAVLNVWECRRVR